MQGVLCCRALAHGSLLPYETLLSQLSFRGDVFTHQNFLLDVNVENILSPVLRCPLASSRALKNRGGWELSANLSRLGQGVVGLEVYMGPLSEPGSLIELKRADGKSLTYHCKSCLDEGSLGLQAWGSVLQLLSYLHGGEMSFRSPALRLPPKDYHFWDDFSTASPTPRDEVAFYDTIIDTLILKVVKQILPEKSPVVNSTALKTPSELLKVAELCGGDGRLCEKILRTCHVLHYHLLEYNSDLIQRALARLHIYDDRTVCITEMDVIDSTNQWIKRNKRKRAREKIEGTSESQHDCDTVESKAESGWPSSVDLWIASGSVLNRQVGNAKVAEKKNILLRMAKSLAPNGRVILTGLSPADLNLARECLGLGLCLSNICVPGIGPIVPASTNFCICHTWDFLQFVVASATKAQ